VEPLSPDDPWKGCNPLDPSFREDPYPSLARLREIDPVNETPLGFYRLTRYEDVDRLLHRTKCGVRSTSGFLPGIDETVDGPRNFMLLQDPPNHTRLRKLVSHAFTPRALGAWRERITAIVEECLDRVAAKGEMDVIADLALPVPSTLICEMLGVPVADRERFTQWTSQATLGLAAAILPRDLVVLAQEAAFHLREYFQARIEERRRERRQDLLSVLVAAEEAGDRLSTDELLAQSVGLLIAGFETTIGLIGNGIRALARHPAELAKLRSRPDLVPKAVRECLRYDGPILLTQRVLHEEAEFGGKRIAKDTMIWGMLSAANRDPGKFADPDRFDVERDASAHLAFGGGPHFCLGYRLAELEAEAAIGAFVRRFADVRLASETVEWGASLFRVPGRLPVTFRGA
jgi:cytochrome P450